jgi:hypothetical protein
LLQSSRKSAISLAMQQQQQQQQEQQQPRVQEQSNQSAKSISFQSPHIAASSSATTARRDSMSNSMVAFENSDGSKTASERNIGGTNDAGASNAVMNANNNGISVDGQNKLISSSLSSSAASTPNTNPPSSPSFATANSPALVPADELQTPRSSIIAAAFPSSQQREQQQQQAPESPPLHQQRQQAPAVSGQKHEVHTADMELFIELLQGRLRKAELNNHHLRAQSQQQQTELDELRADVQAKQHQQDGQRETPPKQYDGATALASLSSASSLPSAALPLASSSSPIRQDASSSSTSAVRSPEASRLEIQQLRALVAEQNARLATAAAHRNARLSPSPLPSSASALSASSTSTTSPVKLQHAHTLALNAVFNSVDLDRLRQVGSTDFLGVPFLGDMINLYFVLPLRIFHAIFRQPQEAESAVHERVHALQCAADHANAEIARMRADADRERAGMETCNIPPLT